MKQAIRQRLGRFLAMRPHSEKEVERYLMRKEKQYELTHEDIQSLLLRYKDVGLINDELFTESCVHSALSKGKGARYIHTKLHAAGVSEECIQSFLSRLPADDIHAAMTKRLHKYEKKWATLSGKEKRMKAMAILFSSGFPGKDIAPFIDDWLVKE